MSYSFTTTESSTFTITHAKHIAAKVATDLKRMQRFYGYPSDDSIDEYESEITLMLKHGYLETVAYGFKKNGNWIEPTLKYEASDFSSGTNDDPGRIRPNKDVTGASFYSYLTYSAKWTMLNEIEKENFKETLPFQRGGANEPGIDGYLDYDRTYASGGRALSRATIRSN